ncbi:MAG: phosphoribosyl-ATP diphosphatase [Candidatus Pelagibacter sp.]|nr:phosphoribosyl-ATP diphosphatase [Candidatus Pelagibacter sp.]|tara:strand:- start:140 stop:454 length:315 start_codon:yes stop_codon:yes gene_type:complete
MFEVLEELINIIRERKNSTEQYSYTKRLLSNNTLCREKVMEEVKELVDALNKKKNQVHEAADVIYHMLVLLEANNIKVEEVMSELKKRQGTSGLVEKTRRHDLR